MANDHIADDRKKVRLIDANDVYALFDVNGFARLHVGDIDTIPRVDAVEVVHGRWIPAGITEDLAECSVCGKMNHTLHYVYSIGFKYCPQCGAKMDGDGNG